MIRLKQSTASQEVPLGPFVDATDGFTLEDALGPIAASDIKLWKNGASTMVNASGTAVFDVDGTYIVTLNATDTNTIGPLAIIVSPSGARPIRVECEVMLAEAFDLEFGTTYMPRLTAILGGVQTGVTHESTACTTTSLTITAIGGGIVPTPTVADQLKGKLVVFTDIVSNPAKVKGLATRIVSQTVGPPIVLTVEPIPAGCVPDVLNSFVIADGSLGTPQTGDSFVRLPAALVGGRIDASVGALQGSVQAANHLTRMGLASASGTLTTGSTTTVLNTAATVPTPMATNQLRGRVVLIVDESGSETALKIQGGRIASNTPTAITLESALTAAPASGTVFIVV